MNFTKVGIAVVFLTASFSAAHAQVANDTIKKPEKKLEGVQLKGSAKRGAESNIINLQKRSVEVVERVGAAQLSKQGVDNVATAVTKATGTQKQESSGVIFVRGLGDRYNTTTLNGLPIPSDDPENKNIDLGIFKTSIVDFISINKIYNPRFTGNVTGANIDIAPKEFTGKPYLELGLSEGINLQTFDKSFYRQMGGPGYSGFFRETFRNSSNPQQTSPFRSGWNFIKTELPVNFGIDLEGGKSFNLSDANRLSVFGYAGFDNNYRYRDGQEGTYSSTGDPLKVFPNVKRYTYDTNTTGVLSIVDRFGKNRIGFTTNFINTSSQDYKTYYGNMREVANFQDLMIKRGENKITQTWINQLFGSHAFSNWNTEWALGYNKVNGERPNVLQNTVIVENPQAPVMYNILGPQNFRYFDKLDNNQFVGYLHLSKIWGAAKFAFGYDGNYEKRDFKNTFFLVGLKDPSVYNLNDLNSVYASNQLLGNVSYSNVGSMPLYGYYYFHNTQQIHSGFLNIDYKFSDRFVAQAGARFDRIMIDNDWYDPLTGIGENTKDYNKILPAVNLKYSITDKQNLRLAASKTYTLPQAKELMPVPYFDVTETVYGNPYLKVSDSYNADLKWELFPTTTELLSVGIFGKYIKDAISRSTIASAANDFTYLNIANWATAFGIEAEIRKDLIKGTNDRFYTFSNVSYMKTKQSLKSATELRDQNNKIADFPETAALQGASDFLANVNLGYNQKFGQNFKNDFDFVVSYSYIGKALYSIGIIHTGDYFQQPVNDLNANFKVNFHDKYGFQLKASNLLNPKYEIKLKNDVGNYVYRSYTRGIDLSLGFNYKF